MATGQVFEARRTPGRSPPAHSRPPRSARQTIENHADLFVETASPLAHPRPVRVEPTCPHPLDHARSGPGLVHVPPPRALTWGPEVKRCAERFSNKLSSPPPPSVARISCIASVGACRLYRCGETSNLRPRDRGPAPASPPPSRVAFSIFAKAFLPCGPARRAGDWRHAYPEYGGHGRHFMNCRPQRRPMSANSARGGKNARTACCRKKSSAADDGRWRKVDA